MREKLLFWLVIATIFSAHMTRSWLIVEAEQYTENLRVIESR